MLITSEGVIIRLRGNEISSLGRVSQGVKLINLNENVTVVGVAKDFRTRYTKWKRNK